MEVVKSDMDVAGRELNLAGFRVGLSICLPAVRRVLCGSRYGGGVAASGLLAARTELIARVPRTIASRYFAPRCLGAAWQRIYPMMGP